MSLVDAAHRAHARIDTLRYSPENTGHFDIIARPHTIYEVVKREERYCLRRFALGDITRRLLQANHLLVFELAPIVNVVNAKFVAAVGA